MLIFGLSFGIIIVIIILGAIVSAFRLYSRFNELFKRKRNYGIVYKKYLEGLEAEVGFYLAGSVIAPLYTQNMFLWGFISITLYIVFIRACVKYEATDNKEK